MTYVSTGLIQATDFNNFVGNGVSGPNLNATWNSTYGQTAVPTVVATGVVTAPGYWTSLNANLAAAATHQGTAITSRTNPTSGAVITVLANVATDISTVYTNRFNAASVGTQFTAWTGTASKTAATGSGAASWTITFTDTVTFANATAATSFFGSGGYLQFQFGKSSTGTVADTEWNAFIGAAGAGGVVAAKVVLTADATSKNLPTWTAVAGTGKTGGTGTPATLATTLGYNQLTATPATIYKQFDAGTAYTSNYVQINASQNAAGVLTLTTTWFDNGDANPGSTAAISGGTATTGVSFGTAPTTIVTAFPPETTNIANTWGTFSIASSVA